MRSFFLFALLVAAASAFVSPAGQTVGMSRTAEAPNMLIDGSVMESAASTANLIATSNADNGGMFFPVAGIISLAALILFLAPPLKED
mmetsp:Transcript_18925/g.29697  ORF Transcript_18925/g.29697 Transcript_18925/m.29697 type:complete len:88 (+) Transcript_18925:66-329(+)